MPSLSVISHTGTGHVNGIETVKEASKYVTGDAYKYAAIFRCAGELWFRSVAGSQLIAMDINGTATTHVISDPESGDELARIVKTAGASSITRYTYDELPDNLLCGAANWNNSGYVDVSDTIQKTTLSDYDMFFYTAFKGNTNPVDGRLICIKHTGEYLIIYGENTPGAGGGVDGSRSLCLQYFVNHVTSATCDSSGVKYTIAHM